VHIPDGYLSPETAVVMYAAATPLWLRASQKIKALLSSRSVPLIALFSAFSFIIMMFNVPVPGGTTAHAVGTTLAAIVVGPWAALVTTSIALIIQAFFFGDGGILNIGANSFNMGIAMAFVGYFVYRWISGSAPITSPRRALAGALAAYIAIDVAALLAGIELGIQPLLFHDAAGHALYFPYALDVSIPAMLVPHLTMAGLAEALVTGLVVAWFQRTNPQLLELTGKVSATTTRTLRTAWMALIALMLFTPLGLLAPGTAWGEWGRQELKALGLSSIPAGFDRLADLWSAPLSGYDIPALNNPTVTYIISAVMGVALVVVVFFLLGWIVDHFLRQKDTQTADSRTG
jgi:cobalt/nickel transport system permease protein